MFVDQQCWDDDVDGDENAVCQAFCAGHGAELWICFIDVCDPTPDPDVNNALGGGGNPRVVGWQTKRPVGDHQLSKRYP